MTDALAAWLDTRGALLEPALLVRASQAPLVWAKRDGHRRFIDEHDVRKPERAKRMRTALRATRERADERPSLDVAALVALASIALGARPGLREGPAYAKGGAEVYDVDGTLLARFPRALAEIDDTHVPLLVRAARVYLDVCFFHPLVDGNARAARLAFDFVLARGGVRFDLVAPLFLVARPAGDAGSHQALVRTVCTLAEATARRLARDASAASGVDDTHDARGLPRTARASRADEPRPLAPFASTAAHAPHEPTAVHEPHAPTPAHEPPARGPREAHERGPRAAHERGPHAAHERGPHERGPHTAHDRGPQTAHETAPTEHATHDQERR